MAEPIKNEEPASMVEILTKAASTDRGVRYQDASITNDLHEVLSYKNLLRMAFSHAQALQRLAVPGRRSFVLIKFKLQIDMIIWFWAACIAKMIPILLPSSIGTEKRQVSYLRHLQDVLQQALLVTDEWMTTDLPEGFSLTGQTGFLHPINIFNTPQDSIEGSVAVSGNSDIAAAMLTSGSTGLPKVVPYKLQHILNCLNGKIAFHNLTMDDSLLGWIGMDHVANLMEIHLLAVLLQANQVQVQPEHFLVKPLAFLDVCEEFKVTYTFMPNFQIASLNRALSGTERNWDLAHLKRIVSGGEANPLSTLDEFNVRLGSSHLSDSAICPAFGMTETCAGCIYQDEASKLEDGPKEIVAAVGKPIAHLQVRVAAFDGSNAAGELQLKGNVLFTGYYRNDSETQKAFTEDGWFRTGDIGTISSNNVVRLIGRQKEVISVNGRNIHPQELEVAIDEQGFDGIVPGSCVAFPIKGNDDGAEGYVVCFFPTFDSDNVVGFEKAFNGICRIGAATIGINPSAVLPLPRESLSKNTLGKPPRLQTKANYTNGLYAEIEQSWKNKLLSKQDQDFVRPSTITEVGVIESAAAVMRDLPEMVGASYKLGSLGTTSLQWFEMKARLQDLLGIRDIPIAIFLSGGTVREIAAKIDEIAASAFAYNPVVQLQSSGERTPLWLIHPGSGDVVVFLPLIKHFPDRPIYAIRTRGLEPNQSYFETIDEAAETYWTAIRKVQPSGPYAIGGYSLGSTLAFEVGKMMERDGHRCGFVGIFDGLPDIANLIANETWNTVAINIAYFHDLIPENCSIDAHKKPANMTADEVITFLLKVAPASRLQELNLTRERFRVIVDATNAFRLAARKYTCRGSVERVDVFYVDPLTSISPNKKDWRENYLEQWKPYSRGAVHFHECVGSHASMFSEQHVEGLQQRIKAALSDCGL